MRHLLSPLGGERVNYYPTLESESSQLLSDI